MSSDSAIACPVSAIDLEALARTRLLRAGPRSRPGTGVRSRSTRPRVARGPRPGRGRRRRTAAPTPPTRTRSRRGRGPSSRSGPSSPNAAGARPRARRARGSAPSPARAAPRRISGMITGRPVRKTSGIPFRRRGRVGTCAASSRASSTRCGSTCATATCRIEPSSSSTSTAHQSARRGTASSASRVQRRVDVERRREHLARLGEVREALACLLELRTRDELALLAVGVLHPRVVHVRHGADPLVDVAVPVVDRRRRGRRRGGTRRRRRGTGASPPVHGAGVAGGDPPLEQRIPVAGLHGVDPPEPAVRVPRLAGVLRPRRLRLDERAGGVGGPVDRRGRLDQRAVASLAPLELAASLTLRPPRARSARAPARPAGRPPGGGPSGPRSTRRARPPGRPPRRRCDPRP